MSTRWQRCPGKGRLGGQVVFAAILEVGEELRKELLGSSELVAEDATHGQVVERGLGEERSCCISRPGAGYRPQRFAVDLGVDRRRESAAVTQKLADLRQRCARPQHLCRRCMAQTMSMDAPEAGASSGGSHNLAYPLGAEGTMRRLDPHEYRPSLGLVGRLWCRYAATASPTSVGNGRRSVHFPLPRTTISPARQSISSSPKRGDFARPHAKTDQHCQDGDVAAAIPSAAIA